MRDQDLRQLEKFLYMLLEKVHAETDCGRDGRHWPQCQALTFMFGWKSSGHAHSLVPVPHTPRPPKASAHDGRDAAGDPVHRPLDLDERKRSSARETCMNRGIEAKPVTSPAPSRDHLSARTAPVVRRLTPTPEPTPSEREPTSQNPPLVCSLAGGGLGAGALMVR
jgi:hypothetical protein